MVCIKLHDELTLSSRNPASLVDWWDASGCSDADGSLATPVRGGGGGGGCFSLRHARLDLGELLGRVGRFSGRLFGLDPWNSTSKGHTALLVARRWHTAVPASIAPALAVAVLVALAWTTAARTPKSGTRMLRHAAAPARVAPALLVSVLVTLSRTAAPTAPPRPPLVELLSPWKRKPPRKDRHRNIIAIWRARLAGQRQECVDLHTGAYTRSSCAMRAERREREREREREKQL